MQLASLIAHTSVLVLVVVGVTVLAMTGNAPVGLIGVVYGAALGYATGVAVASGGNTQ